MAMAVVPSRMLPGGTNSTFDFLHCVWTCTCSYHYSKQLPSTLNLGTRGDTMLPLPQAVPAPVPEHGVGGSGVSH